MATVGIHALGTTAWIRRLQIKSANPTFKKNFGNSLWVLCSTVTVLLMLHIVEVMVWALAYISLPDLEQINDIEEAVYFSMVTYASLGYGDIVMSNSWRLLSAIEAMTGLLIFGWSTALLYAVVQRMWSEDSSDHSGTD